MAKKSLTLQVESIRVLSAPELDAVDGGLLRLGWIKKLFDVQTRKVMMTDGPTESFDLGYRGPARNPWIWDPAKRVWLAR